MSTVRMHLINGNERPTLMPFFGEGKAVLLGDKAQQRWAVIEPHQQEAPMLHLIVDPPKLNHYSGPSHRQCGHVKHTNPTKWHKRMFPLQGEAVGIHRTASASLLDMRESKHGRGIRSFQNETQRSCLTMTSSPPNTCTKLHK